MHKDMHRLKSERALRRLELSITHLAELLTL